MLSIKSTMQAIAAAGRPVKTLLSSNMLHCSRHRHEVDNEQNRSCNPVWRQWHTIMATLAQTPAQAVPAPGWQ
jgi:hypothetical protein